MTLNREQRKEVAQLVRQYLNEELTAFEFDEALWEYRDSDDTTVGFVVDQVWYFYDDCDDHLVALEKPVWDYHHRLLLLLESDFEVQETRTLGWSWTQLIAGFCLAGFGLVAARVGWSEQLLFYAIPFGLVSIAISIYRAKSRVSGPYDEIVMPFRSIADLKLAYEQTATFHKQRYPRQLKNRKVRSRLALATLYFQHYMRWLMFSPLPLAFQLLPPWESRTTANPPCSLWLRGRI